MTRKSSNYNLLIAIVLSGIGTFMFLPLMAIELVSRGLSTSQTGIIVGLLSGTGSVLSIAVGSLMEKIGTKSFAVTGPFLRSLGLLVFMFSPAWWGYCIAAIFASLGSSMTSLAIKTELINSSKTRKSITLRSIAVNTGALFGPAIGGLLYYIATFKQIIVIVVCIYFLLAILLFFTTFAASVNKSGLITSNSNSNSKKIQFDKRLLFFLLSVFCYWLIYSQWAMVMPILASHSLGFDSAAPMMYSFNAVLILLLQYWLLVKCLNNLPAHRVSFIAFSIFVMAFLMILLPNNLLSIIGFVMLFTVAEMLISPSLDEMATEINEKDSLATLFGAMTTISGFAMIIGATLGGYLIETNKNYNNVIAMGVLVSLLGLVCVTYIKSSEKTLEEI